MSTPIDRIQVWASIATGNVRAIAEAIEENLVPEVYGVKLLREIRDLADMLARKIDPYSENDE